MFKQTLALLTTNLRSILARPANSLITIVGIGGVVAVLISIFAVAQGFERTLATTGSADRALVLRAGSTSEINGSIPAGQYGPISNLPHVARSDAEPIASRETYVTVNLKRRDGKGEGSAPMRGVNKQSYLVRDELSLIEGRDIEFGKYEMIAGISAAADYEQLDIGQTIRLRGIEWRVVGLFQAHGSAYQSELWVDERLLAQSRGRGDTFSSMLVKLTDPSKMAAFQQSLLDDRRLTAHAIRESEYYAAQAGGTAGLIKGIGALVTVIMAIGAFFAALNTMYAALASRSIEIATLRSLGFNRGPIAAATLLESALLGLLGAILGSLVVYVFLNGLTLSTVAATTSTFTQIAFSFQVTLDLMVVAVLVSVLLGMIGGLLPTLRAIRLPIVQGLRGG